MFPSLDYDIVVIIVFFISSLWVVFSLHCEYVWMVDMRALVCLVIPRWQTRVVNEKRWKAIFRSVMLLLRLWWLLTACRCHVGRWSTVVYWGRVRLLLLLLISISPCIVVFIIVPISIIVCHFILVAMSTVPNAARLLSSLIWLWCSWEWHMKRVKRGKVKWDEINRMDMKMYETRWEVIPLCVSSHHLSV